MLPRGLPRRVTPRYVDETLSSLHTRDPCALPADIVGIIREYALSVTRTVKLHDVTVVLPYYRGRLNGTVEYRKANRRLGASSIRFEYVGGRPSAHPVVSPGGGRPVVSPGGGRPPSPPRELRRYVDPPFCPYITAYLPPSGYPCQCGAETFHLPYGLLRYEARCAACDRRICEACRYADAYCTVFLCTGCRPRCPQCFECMCPNCDVECCWCPEDTSSLCRDCDTYALPAALSARGHYACREHGLNAATPCRYVHCGSFETM